MRENDVWVLALPPPTVEHILETFLVGFRELAKGSDEPFEYGLRETDITEILALHLQTLAPRMTLVGEWFYEVVSNTKRRNNRRRTDIQYFTVHDNKYRIQLVFECKKLDGPSEKRHRRHLTAYKDKGMLRFADGSYAPKEPIGFMVGFSDRATDNVMEAVRRSFSGGAWKVQLGMGTYPDGQQWRRPPLQFAKQADFETMHTRVSDFPDITLYHLELAFAQ